MKQRKGNIETQLSQHIIMADGDGVPLDPSDKERVLTDREFDSHIDSVLDGIRNIKPRAGKKKILIFIHGGLNKLTDGLDRAAQLRPQISEAGYHPLFIIWRSGLRSSYLEHLLSVRQGRLARNRSWFTALAILLADLGRGFTRLLVVWGQQLSTYRKSVRPNLDPERGNVSALYARLRERFATAPDEIAVSRGEDNLMLPDRLKRNRSYLYTIPFKIISLPFIDAIGRPGWINMLRRTKTLFRQPSEFHIDDRRDDPTEVERALDSPATGALSRFCRSFARLPNVDQYEITLVGHSMGTIVLNRLLRHLPDIPYAQIVYLAAACTIRDFANSVIPYLHQQQDTRFYNLCLHPVAEAGEINYHDFPIRGSLLEWIDDFLALPETTSDRTMGKWDNVLQATHLIPKEVRRQVHIKAFAVGEDPAFPEGNPQKHGEFSRLPFWDKSFWEPHP